MSNHDLRIFVHNSNETNVNNENNDFRTLSNLNQKSTNFENYAAKVKKPINPVIQKRQLSTPKDLTKYFNRYTFISDWSHLVAIKSLLSKRIFLYETFFVPEQ